EFESQAWPRLTRREVYRLPHDAPRGRWQWHIHRPLDSQARGAPGTGGWWCRLSWLPFPSRSGCRPREEPAPKGRASMNDPEPSHGHDLYALPAEAIQEPPHSLRQAIRKIGPGLILAASIVGTGELIDTTSLGAKAGFSLLWLILLSCVIKVFVQVELGRYAITQGKTTLAAFDSLPGPRAGASWLCWLWLFMTLATLAQAAAMEGTVGQAAHMAFPAASQ